MAFLRRILALGRRARLDREIEAELREHIQMCIDDNVAAGKSREQAEREARLRFGNPAATRERVAEEEAALGLEALLRDLRFAVRGFVKTPAFTIVAIFTLALGIGAATAIFSAVKAVLLDPLPFREPQRLVHLWEGVGDERYHMGDEAYFSSSRPGNFFGWKLGSQSFEDVSAYFWRTMLLSGKERADLVTAHDVYDRFFETLGTPALLGRTLQASDYTPNAGRVVVLSYRMWQQRFASDPRVLGSRIVLDRQSYEIVGVMPAGFYPTANASPELWTPHVASQKELDDFSTWGLVVIARLKPGVTWEQAQSELFVLSARITLDRPTLEKVHAIVVPMSAQLVGSSWKLLLLLSGGVALLLLTACTTSPTCFWLARSIANANSRCAPRWERDAPV